MIFLSSLYIGRSKYPYFSFFYSYATSTYLYCPCNSSKKNYRLKFQLYLFYDLNVNRILFQPPPPPSTNVRYYFSNPNNYKNLNNEVAITDLSSLPPFKLPSNISAFIWQRLFVDVLVSPTLTLICLFRQPFFVFFSHSFFQSYSG